MEASPSSVSFAGGSMFKDESLGLGFSLSGATNNTYTNNAPTTFTTSTSQKVGKVNDTHAPPLPLNETAKYPSKADTPPPNPTPANVDKSAAVPRRESAVPISFAGDSLDFNFSMASGGGLSGQFGAAQSLHGASSGAAAAASLTEAPIAARPSDKEASEIKESEQASRTVGVDQKSAASSQSRRPPTVNVDDPNDPLPDISMDFSVSRVSDYNAQKNNKDTSNSTQNGQTKTGPLNVVREDKTDTAAYDVLDEDTSTTTTTTAAVTAASVNSTALLPGRKNIAKALVRGTIREIWGEDGSTATVTVVSSATVDDVDDENGRPRQRADEDPTAADLDDDDGDESLTPRHDVEAICAPREAEQQQQIAAEVTVYEETAAARKIQKSYRAHIQKNVRAAVPSSDSNDAHRRSSNGGRQHQYENGIRGEKKLNSHMVEADAQEVNPQKEKSVKLELIERQAETNSSGREGEESRKDREFCSSLTWETDDKLHSEADAARTIQRAYRRHNRDKCITKEGKEKEKKDEFETSDETFITVSGALNPQYFEAPRSGTPMPREVGNEEVAPSQTKDRKGETTNRIPKDDSCLSTASAIDKRLGGGNRATGEVRSTEAYSSDVEMSQLSLPPHWPRHHWIDQLFADMSAKTNYNPAGRGINRQGPKRKALIAKVIDAMEAVGEDNASHYSSAATALSADCGHYGELCTTAQHIAYYICQKFDLVNLSVQLSVSGEENRGRADEKNSSGCTIEWFVDSDTLLDAALACDSEEISASIKRVLALMGIGKLRGGGRSAECENGSALFGGGNPSSGRMQLSLSALATILACCSESMASAPRSSGNDHSPRQNQRPSTSPLFVAQLFCDAIMKVTAGRNQEGDFSRHSNALRNAFSVCDVQGDRLVEACTVSRHLACSTDQQCGTETEKDNHLTFLEFCSYILSTSPRSFSTQTRERGSGSRSDFNIDHAVDIAHHLSACTEKIFASFVSDELPARLQDSLEASRSNVKQQVISAACDLSVALEMWKGLRTKGKSCDRTNNSNSSHVITPSPPRHNNNHHSSNRTSNGFRSDSYLSPPAQHDCTQHDASSPHKYTGTHSTPPAASPPKIGTPSSLGTRIAARRVAAGLEAKTAVTDEAQETRAFSENGVDRDMSAPRSPCQSLSQVLKSICAYDTSGLVGPNTLPFSSYTLVSFCLCFLLAHEEPMCRKVPKIYSKLFACIARTMAGPASSQTDVKNEDDAFTTLHQNAFKLQTSMSPMRRRDRDAGAVLENNTEEGENTYFYNTVLECFAELLESDYLGTSPSSSFPPLSWIEVNPALIPISIFFSTEKYIVPEYNVLSVVKGNSSCSPTTKPSCGNVPREYCQSLQLLLSSARAYLASVMEAATLFLSPCGAVTRHRINGTSAFYQLTSVLRGLSSARPKTTDCPHGKATKNKQESVWKSSSLQHYVWYSTERANERASPETWLLIEGVIHQAVALARKRRSVRQSAIGPGSYSGDRASVAPLEPSPPPRRV